MSKKNKNQEPAEQNYFFGKCFLDLWKTIANGWKENGRKITGACEDVKRARKTKNHYSAFCIMIFRIVELISITIFGTLFTLVFSLAHIAIISVLAFGIYLWFAIVWLADSTFCLFSRIGTSCYTPSCNRRFSLPVYLCPNPNCRAKHYKLRPGKYGIVIRKCKCGYKIPTTFFNGRQNLEALCPYCYGKVINGVHRSIQIPVIGGASSGKTCFINMAIKTVEDKATEYGLHYQYHYIDGDEYKQNIEGINSNHLPKKTNDRNFKCYNFYLTPHKHKVHNLISICDIAGEVFSRQDSIRTQQGYRLADGMILIVDPLSMPQYRKSVEQRIGKEEVEKYNPSSQYLSDLLSCFITMLENLYHISGNKTIKKTLVIAISKNDIPGLRAMIGLQAVKEYQQNNPDSTLCEAYNALCEKFLSDNGESNFLFSIKDKFDTVQFFSFSSIDHDKSISASSPENVDYPLLWIVDKLNKPINLSSIWDEQI